MRLVDLEPRWIHQNLFIFRCPHCRETYLSCKNVTMSQKEQRAIFAKEFGDDGSPFPVVGSKPDMAWSIVGDFANMTVTPSIDASDSRHWHGFITNGEIR